MTRTVLAASLPGESWPVWLALLVPLTAAVMLGVGSRTRDGIGRRAALAISVGAATLALVGVVGTALAHQTVDQPWAPALGIRLHLALDGLSWPPALVACLASLAAALVVGRDDGNDADGNEAGLHALHLLLLEASLVTLMARDVLLLVIALAGVVLPVWAIAFDRSAGQRKDRRRTASRVSGSLGSGVVLATAGALVLTSAAGTSSLDRFSAGLVGAPRSEVLAGTVLITLATVLLVPLVPGHTWWTGLVAAAPAATRVIVAGGVLPLGGYLAARLLALPVIHAAGVGPWLAAVAALTMAWAGLAAFAQPNLARLLALAGMVHGAGAVLGVAAGGRLGVQAGALALAVAGLVGTTAFTVLAALERSWGTTRVDHTREALRLGQPRLGRLVVGGLAAVGAVPGTVAFWPVVWGGLALLSEGRRAWWTWPLGVGFAVGLVMLLAVAVRVISLVWASGWTVAMDPTSTVELPRPVPDASGALRWAALLLVSAVIVLGLLPGPLARIADAAATAVLGGA